MSPWPAPPAQSRSIAIRGSLRRRAPRDPELTNRWAKLGLAFGIGSVFVGLFCVPSVIAFVFCGLGLARARALDREGKGLYGRRRALWGLGLAVFGVAQTLYFLIVAKYL